MASLHEFAFPALAQRLLRPPAHGKPADRALCNHRGKCRLQKKVTKAKTDMARLRAQTDAERKIIEAKADAEAAKQMARAHAEEQRAETAGVTPMEVMVHAYDALAHLGGTGTTIVLGDWAHLPNFLFPRVPSLHNAFTLPFMPYAPVQPQPPAPTTSGSPVLSSIQ